VATVALVGCSGHVQLGRDNYAVGKGGDGGGGAHDDAGMGVSGAGGAPGGPTGSAGTGGAVDDMGGIGGTGGAVDNTGGIGGFVPDMPVVTCIADHGATDPGDAAAAMCPCTRRDGQGSLNCPVGTGKYWGSIVGPEGGVVVLDGTPSTLGVPVKLTVPYGALTEAHAITITETRCPPPDAYHDWSPVYQIDPPDLTFVTPAALEMPFEAKDPDPAGSSGFVVPKTVSIYESHGGAFTRLPDSYVNAGFSQATVKQLGSFFVGYPKPDAQFACP
jgi:hypothetical protein